MSGSISYVFYAIDKPLSRAERAAVASLSRRASPTGRRAEFWYDVDGYDLPAPYESLMAKYYDIVVRQDYDQWTLGMAWPFDPALYDKLKAFECDDGEGCGIRVIPIDAGYPQVKKRVSEKNRLLAEITAFIDYDILESLEGLRDLPWERSPEDEEEKAEAESIDEEDWNYSYEYEDSIEEILARLANCIREDVTQGDLRAFYLAWDKLHDPDSSAHPERPKTKKRLPPYLKNFSQMLKTSIDL